MKPANLPTSLDLTSNLWTYLNRAISLNTYTYIDERPVLTCLDKYTCTYKYRSWEVDIVVAIAACLQASKFKKRDKIWPHKLKFSTPLLDHWCQISNFGACSNIKKIIRKSVDSILLIRSALFIRPNGIQFSLAQGIRLVEVQRRYWLKRIPLGVEWPKARTYLWGWREKGRF